MLQNSSIMKSNDIQPIGVFVKERRLFIKSIDGEIFSFVVKNDDFISDIKMEIYDKTGLIVEEQILCYQGEILEDVITLSDYEIINNSVIDIVGKLRGGMQIFIKLMSGRRIEIEIDNRDKIRNLKLKIQEKIGLPLNEQKLVYQGRILQNNKTIDEYQICDKSEISVVAKLGNDEIKIFAKTSDGKTVEIEVEKSVKIIDLKRNIKEEIGFIADKQKLVYQGVVLDDNDKSIDEYQICDQSVINIVAKILIFVTTSGGKIETIEMYETDKIKDLKHQIQEKLQLNLDKQTLVFEERTLDDDEKTIYEYQLCNQSMIFLRCTEIHISVTTPNNEIINFKTLISDKIGDIKKKIELQSGFPLDEQSLNYKDKILDDDEKTIDEYQIIDKSMIYMRRQKIQIIVKISDDRTITIHVDESDKIEDLKKQIADRTGINTADQSLIYQGSEMKNGEKIEKYQIQKRSVINLVSNLKGGKVFHVFNKKMYRKFYSTTRNQNLF